MVIDRSGSMSGMEKAIVDGYGEYTDGLDTDECEIKLSTMLFDYMDGEGFCAKWLNERVAPANAKMDIEDYVPRGWTPLYDAIGATIDHLDEQVPDDERALVCIMTDGLENYSKEYDGPKIKEKIERFTAKGNWTFVFFSSGHGNLADTIDYAVNDLGVTAGNVGTYSADAASNQTAMRSSGKGSSAMANSGETWDGATGPGFMATASISPDMTSGQTSPPQTIGPIAVVCDAEERAEEARKQAERDRKKALKDK